jgi:hypothetical protein
VEEIERFLELVRRETGATDARLELGGRPPRRPELVAHEIDDGIRLVAVFVVAPDDREAVTEKLAALASSFSTIVDRIRPEPDLHLAPVAPSTRTKAHAALDDALGVLARHADAIAALVIDEGSPVVWGSSQPRPRIEDVDLAVRVVEGLDRGDDLADLEKLASIPLDDDQVATLRAIVETRHADAPRLTLSEDELGVLSRPFGGIYRLVLSFDRPFPTLRAEGALRRALPAIERLVTDLPPLDDGPKGKGGRVLSLRPL